MGAVTYIDDQRNHRTFSFELIEKHGKYSSIIKLCARILGIPVPRGSQKISGNNHIPNH